MTFFGTTDRGMVRAVNQDAYRVLEFPALQAGVMVLCDGMGGEKAGEVASSLAVDSFIEYARQRFTEPEPPLAVDVAREATAWANLQVYDRASRNDEWSGMGTTLVAAVITADDAVVVNVGDSRCYWLAEGQLQQVTRDHSLVQEMVDQGVLDREQARSHPRRNVITRAVGLERRIRSDVFRIDFRHAVFADKIRGVGPDLGQRGDALSALADGDALEKFARLVEDHYRRRLGELGQRHRPEGGYRHKEILVEDPSADDAERGFAQNVVTRDDIRGDKDTASDPRQRRGKEERADADGENGRGEDDTDQEPFLLFRELIFHRSKDNLAVAFHFFAAFQRFFHDGGFVRAFFEFDFEFERHKVEGRRGDAGRALNSLFHFSRAVRAVDLDGIRFFHSSSSFLIPRRVPYPSRVSS